MKAGLLVAFVPFVAARCAPTQQPELASAIQTDPGSVASLSSAAASSHAPKATAQEHAEAVPSQPSPAAPSNTVAAPPKTPDAEDTSTTALDSAPTISVPPSGEMVVPGDKPLYVIHAPPDNSRVIVYLHGMCGNIYAVNSWREVAAQHGTLIALRGDTACGHGRYRWKDPIPVLQKRITRALEIVQNAREGALDPSDLTLMGYSQGAARAERLATQYPDKYQRVILGGPPRQPKVENLQNAAAVAVIGGELETYGHMLAGAEALQAAGKPARFFLLPSAEHGEYGPLGGKVMSEVFHWVLEPDSSLAQGNVTSSEAEKSL